MAFFYILVAGALLGVTAVEAVLTCNVTFDGRIARDAPVGLFASDQSPFSPKYVHGQNVTWDQIITFPPIKPTRLDNAANAKPIQVRIDDDSLFGSSSEGVETALRRAELLLTKRNDTVSGRKTWFYSFRASSTTRPLNLTHEYVVAFHESQDFQADFYSVKIGTPMDAAVGYGRFIDGANKTAHVTQDMMDRGQVIYVQGYKWARPVQTYFMAPFALDVWHNFGLYLDYVDDRMQVFYSTGERKLEVSTPLLANNLSGAPPTVLGETHIGIQKRPVGANLTDFLYEGVQEEGIDEALCLGGIVQIDGRPQDCGLL